MHNDNHQKPRSVMRPITEAEMTMLNELDDQAKACTAKLTGWEMTFVEDLIRKGPQAKRQPARSASRRCTPGRS